MQQNVSESPQDIDIDQVERMLRASIAIMKRSRRQSRRDTRGESTQPQDAYRGPSQG
ncbi:hypothetical protein [Salinarimonas soli]|uniref:hypothetical protein n=1 Tax=Salinarimonas soli TaxID=1638099 RepID=UPI0016620351|nr:hypothetical protein [Salinarimonas soli]